MGDIRHHTETEVDIPVPSKAQVAGKVDKCAREEDHKPTRGQGGTN